MGKAFLCKKGEGAGSLAVPFPTIPATELVTISVCNRKQGFTIWRREEECFFATMKTCNLSCLCTMQDNNYEGQLSLSLPNKLELMIKNIHIKIDNSFDLL